mmetsp:Transcript_6448/g.18258  ORF Transcript_6448/g.18258 Transcript_6448/m.18258 type:complete len:508 (-) Transcript_6448:220-1743(-)
MGVLLEEEGLNFLEGEALCLGHVLVDEEDGPRKDAREDGEGERAPDGIELDEEEERHNEVQEEVDLHGEGHGLAAHLQGEDFGDERPGHRAEADLVAADVCEQAREDDDLLRVQATVLIVVDEREGHREERDGHDRVAHIEQLLAPHPLHKNHAADSRHELEATGEKVRLGTDAGVVEDARRVVEHRRLGGDLLQRDHADAADELRVVPRAHHEPLHLRDEALLLGPAGAIAHRVNLVDDLERHGLDDVLMEDGAQRLSSALIIAVQSEPARRRREPRTAQEHGNSQRREHEVGIAPAAFGVLEHHAHDVAEQHAEDDHALLASHEAAAQARRRHLRDVRRSPVHGKADANAIDEAPDQHGAEADADAGVDEAADRGEGSAEHVEHRTDHELAPAAQRVGDGEHDDAAQEGAGHARRGEGTLHDLLVGRVRPAHAGHVTIAELLDDERRRPDVEAEEQPAKGREDEDAEHAEGLVRLLRRLGQQVVPRRAGEVRAVVHLAAIAQGRR